MAEKNFANHKVVQRQPNQWLVRNETSFYWTEVTTTAQGIVCTGDCGLAYFRGYYSSGPRDALGFSFPEAIIRWVGQSPVLTDYYVEKARDGTCRDHVMRYEDEVLLWDLVASLRVDSSDQNFHEPAMEELSKRFPSAANQHWKKVDPMDLLRQLGFTKQTSVIQHELLKLEKRHQIRSLHDKDMETDWTIAQRIERLYCFDPNGEWYNFFTQVPDMAVFNSHQAIRKVYETFTIQSPT